VQNAYGVVIHIDDDGNSDDICDDNGGVDDKDNRNDIGVDGNVADNDDDDNDTETTTMTKVCLQFNYIWHQQR
jgi:hypothetical protein